MPPQCCRCTGQGRCRSCKCVRDGVPCSNCTPGRNGRCENGRCENAIAPAQVTAQPLATSPEASLPPDLSEESAQALDDGGGLTETGARTEEILPSNPSPHMESRLHPTSTVLLTSAAIPTITSVAPTAIPTEPVDVDGTPLASLTISSAAPTAIPTAPGAYGAPISDSSYPGLPEFPSMGKPTFTWGDLCGEEFTQILNATYTEVVHWRRNTFTIPFGRAGKNFVTELSRLYLAFGSSSSLEAIALKAAIVFPILLLQKPSKGSKTKVHITCLERRLASWTNGDLDELVREGRAIQQRLPKHGSARASGNLAHNFSNLMFMGKCKAALDLLSKDNNGGLLHLDDPADAKSPNSPTVREELISKHPPGQPAYSSCILPSEPQDPHHVIFDSLDADTIRSAALKVNGAAGPSGLDAHGWRRLCTCFKGASRDLCASLASVARRICSSYVNPTLIAPMLACRLIALDKNPGVRPIGIGDTARRIIAKALLSIAAPDIQDASGCQQLCGGQIAGIEAAVHATRSAFESDDCEAVLLVDATNAFNALNRMVALHNIRRICPSIATILINSYRSPTELFVDGDVILSQEGTTQGDPLAMAMYGLATIPLIRRLDGLCTQVWYTDDSAAAGRLVQLREWWDKLASEGPSFGYYANPSKMWLVTKDDYLEEASAIFADSGVNITSNGRPYLGAVIGSQEFAAEYVRSKVSDWSSKVALLGEIAKSQPHAAYSALTHGLLSKWTYLSRVIPNIADKFSPLDDVLRSDLLPALTGRPPPSDLEFALFALPARLGGLGIRIPSKAAEGEFQSSLLVTSPLKDHILSQNSEYGYETIVEQLQCKATISKLNREKSVNDANDLYDHLQVPLQRAMDLAREKGASTWLTVLPLTEHGFSLHKSAFHDAMALRYGWSPTKIPYKCDCGNGMTVEHALSCAKGGFPTLRHNEIRDFTANLLTEVCNDVCVEPDLQPVMPHQLTGATANRQDGARLDISANGVWGGRYEKTYFDVRVFNPHAPSNKNMPLSACYKKHEREKKRAYEQRVREVEHSSLTPLVFAATGGLGNEATSFYKRLASLLSQKWEAPYSTTLRWLRCRLAFSLLRSSIQAIRGARSSRGHAARLPNAVDLVTSESRISGDP